MRSSRRATSAAKDEVKEKKKKQEKDEGKEKAKKRGKEEEKGVAVAVGTAVRNRTLSRTQQKKGLPPRRKLRRIGLLTTKGLRPGAAQELELAFSGEVAIGHWLRSETRIRTSSAIVVIAMATMTL